MAVTLHRHDLPDGLDLGPVVAIDTETMGLDPRRDRLCLVQLSAGDGDAHLVQIARDMQPESSKTHTQSTMDKFGRSKDSNVHGSTGGSIVDKTKNALGLGHHNTTTTHTHTHGSGL